ncbi:MAG: lysoplasmalogenase family protein [Clostridia bacterium]|nr:lysoplasmalogenase family protein [Clostridia bacterium]
MNKIKRIVALFAVVLTLAGLFPVTAFADESVPETIEIMTEYQPMGLPFHRKAMVPYTDASFLHPATEFDVTLLRTSIGLAMSAFRTRLAPTGQHKDRVVWFLTEAGFTDIDCSSYDTPPGTDTITNAIAMKRIGKATVIAVPICGDKYGQEWASNVVVGTGTRHQGFSEAAALVKDRLENYIEAHEIEGEIRLWITGYSRSAAVGNFVAADMTASGRFSEVYAYLFATPRNTREPVPYPNIFNIIGRNDPVPMVALAEWGFARNGIDYYTPAQEYDSDYYALKARANAVSQEVLGVPFRNLPEVNADIWLLLQHLLFVAPTQQEYVDELQASFRKGFSDRTAGNLFNTLLEVVDNANVHGKDKALDDMSAYISSLMYKYARGDEYVPMVSGWSESVPLLDNIVREHNPEVYLIWALTAEEPEFFRESGKYHRLIVTGNSALEVYDEDGFVGCFMPDGSKSSTPRVALPGYEDTYRSPADLVYIKGEGKQTLCIPMDRDYFVAIEPLEDGEQRFITMTYRNDALMPVASKERVTPCKKGEIYYAIYGAGESGVAVVTESFDEFEFEEWEDMSIYSPEAILKLQMAGIKRTSIPGMMKTIALIAGALVILALLGFVQLAVCRARAKTPRAATIIGYHAMLTASSFGIEEIARLRFGGVRPLILALKGLATFWVLLLAIRGTRRHRTLRNGLILFALVLCLVGDVTLNVSMLRGMVFQFAAVLVLIVAFAGYGERNWKRAIPGVITFAACAVLLSVFRTAKNELPVPVMWAYAVALGLLAWSVGGQPKTAKTGTALYIVSVMLLFWNLVFGKTVLRHGLSLGCYYVGILLIAASTWFALWKGPAPKVGTEKAEPKEEGNGGSGSPEGELPGTEKQQ